MVVNAKAEAAARRRGKLIVFEGVDGVGKTTVSALFAEELQRRGLDVGLTAEPWPYGAAGEWIRRVLKGEEQASSSWSLALAFACNRMSHLEASILPALAAGKTVVCDRYLLSSFVYQVSSEISYDDVSVINGRAMHADLTFWLDASLDVCVERLEKRGSQRELFENSLADYRQRYRSMMRVRSNWEDGVFAQINADGSSAETLALCLAEWEEMK